MKKIIRKGVFESNSSSTHSLTFCTKEEYEKWRNGEILFDEYEEKFVTEPTFSTNKLKEEYLRYKTQKIANGLLYQNTYYKDMQELVDIVEIDEAALKSTEQSLKEQYVTYTKYWSNDGWSDLEGYVEYYTTPGGEEIVAFGKYGYDG